MAAAATSNKVQSAQEAKELRATRKSGKMVAKKRRSLFSVLFNSKQSGSTSTNTSTASSGQILQPEEEQTQDEAVASYKKKSWLGATATKSQSLDAERFVVIAPSENKCLEATVESLVKAEKEEPQEDEANARKERDEDADSYVLDLNDRLYVEKLEAFKVSKVLRSSSASEQREISREQSPLVAGEWRTNANYIPAPAASKTKTKTKSPMLEQFMDTYKIQLESTSESDESCDDSFSCEWAEARENTRTAAANNNAIDCSTVEQRLESWRRLAAKAAIVGGTADQVSALSSDSELELDDAAFVCYCSDDTSCSSVELVWSRPQLTRRQPPPKISNDAGNRRLSASPLAPVSRVSPAAGSSPQRHAILELAKPSRARGRRFGAKSDGGQRAELAAAAAAATAASRKSHDSWVANPLFATVRKFESVDNLSRGGDASSKMPICLDETLAEDEDELANNLGDGQRNKKQRWSLRMRSPFRGGTAASAETNNSVPQQLVARHLVNLDLQRIRSNVSSMRSQLSERISDTSKRASVLADQLIASIKDTTKEQLAPLASGMSPHDLRDADATLPRDSFGSGGGGTTAANHQHETSDENKKAKLFSLIYQHQQQANGQPVITRQPTRSGGGAAATRVPQPPLAAPPATRPAVEAAPPPPSKHSEAKQLPEEEKNCQTIASGEIGRPVPAARRKLKRTRRQRRQINVAAASDDDADAVAAYPEQSIRKSL